MAPTAARAAEDERPEMTAPYSSAQTPATSGSKTLGIISLVLGIVSLVGFLFLPIVFVLAGIAAVILGFLSRKREPGARGLALTGIILGFIGIALCIISMIIGAILVASMMGSM